MLVVAAIAAVLVLTMSNTAAKEGKANFVVMSFAIDKHAMLKNQSAIVTIGLLNNGTADGTYVLNVTIDGGVAWSKDVDLGMGNSTTVTYNVSSIAAGNHTVGVGDSSTYLNCYDRYAAGANLTYHSVQTITGLMTIEFNWTATVASSNSQQYTTDIDFENNIYQSQTSTAYRTDVWGDGLENLTLVGPESVATHFGVMTLTHYTYTYEANGYHYHVDAYRNDTTNVAYKIVTTTSGATETDELVDTNMAWLETL